VSPDLRKTRLTSFWISKASPRLQKLQKNCVIRVNVRSLDSVHRNPVQRTAILESQSHLHFITSFDREYKVKDQTYCHQGFSGKHAITGSLCFDANPDFHNSGDTSKWVVVIQDTSGVTGSSDTRSPFPQRSPPCCEHENFDLSIVYAQINAE
jgi:hypothetical protein